ncbi:Myristoyl-CoA:protein N-myristoyltransferase, N-terminal domain-containing protein [Mycena galericulata]|nr:Myristoyl-CoA:protein N-myristoyltransferase, N-terminal domain-containing protein [Mycena galericulata]
MDDERDIVHQSQTEHDVGTEDTAGAIQDGSSHQKKKKKKSKSKATTTDALSGNDANALQALEKLKTMSLAEGKAGPGVDHDKNLEAHKFWGTQPVPQLGEGPPLEDGYIEPSKPREEVRQDPYSLPSGFEWTTVDIKDSTQSQEVQELLSLHYVEDQNTSLRLQYSAEFLQWALTPPGYFKEWHLGVRVSSNNKLIAFISGVPITLRVRGRVFVAGEVNYICIHKKLHSKRLAPVLIKEVTRQIHLQGIFQAIYTAGAVIPTPISVCQYYHRSLNTPKLLEIGFTFVPRNMTAARLIRTNKVPETPTLNVRVMEEKDVVPLADLFSRYMHRFDMVPIMTLDDITDFFSMYHLPSSILQSTEHRTLDTVYLYYYATDVAFESGAEEDGRLKARLQTLIGDALVVASQAQMDVFNALTMMDNVPILKDLKFGPGDGYLNFYLYNWRTGKLAGMTDEGGVKAGKGVGVVML